MTDFSFINISQFIMEHAANADAFIYVAIFIGLFIEGTAVLFISYFFVSRGVLDMMAVTAVALLSDFLSSILWYVTGTALLKTNKMRRYVNLVASPFDKQIIKNSLRAFAFSKFIYGTHRIVLIRAGSLNIPLKKYLLYAMLSTALWISIIGFMGFTFSEVALHYLKFIEIVLLIGIIFLYLISWIFSKLTGK